ncbi:response regulator [Sphingobacterium griseoflavum]|uniref:Response regulatory domain-containing protein n=1 Tax=Sphingobacterium griseoflavum TaxID=1474952 RepID=A0ABQ3HWC5_9SPHI|nr:response regulator [Sphingobacterium griseoflavum]GHE34023.1 hypothetical protein GCM10017764_16660 [Sphingobacterium griseoflavum]
MEKRKIFICEDDLAIADVLKTVLEDEGFEVLVETKSVLAFGKLSLYKPHAIITDLQMPIVSGDMLIQAIRRDRQLKNTFILCLTANDRGREIALDSGANMVMHKPFEMEQLAAILDSVLFAKNDVKR